MANVFDNGWVRIVCPECNSKDVRLSNLELGKVVCKGCNHIWERE